MQTQKSNLTKLTFNKNEKLKSRKTIELIFENGKSIKLFPIKIYYNIIPGNETFSIKAGVTVSKRNFKLAVTRNRIKRLMREAYRLNKNILHNALNDKNINLNIMIVYSYNQVETFNNIDKKIKQLFTKLSNNIDIIL